MPLCVFLPSPMSSKSSVASSSSAPAAAVTVGGEAPPGFSREEQAALQWALERKEREPTKVCVCCMPALGCWRLVPSVQ